MDKHVSGYFVYQAIAGVYGHFYLWKPGNGGRCLLLNPRDAGRRSSWVTWQCAAMGDFAGDGEAGCELVG